jgi:uncharacterized protein (UPF0261 family)
VHNANVTLMRTNVAENERIGRFIAEKLNRTKGDVRFLLPMKGVSALDHEGKPFFDKAADDALFTTLEAHFTSSAAHKLVKLPHHINDPEFAKALAEAFHDIV